jgi:hypothetical protein
MRTRTTSIQVLRTASNTVKCPTVYCLSPNQTTHIEELVFLSIGWRTASGGCGIVRDMQRKKT